MASFTLYETNFEWRNSSLNTTASIANVLFTSRYSSPWNGLYLVVNFISILAVKFLIGFRMRIAVRRQKFALYIIRLSPVNETMRRPIWISLAPNVVVLQQVSLPVLGRSWPIISIVRSCISLLIFASVLSFLSSLLRMFSVTQIFPLTVASLPISNSSKDNLGWVDYDIVFQYRVAGYHDQFSVGIQQEAFCSQGDTLI